MATTLAGVREALTGQRRPNLGSAVGAKEGIRSYRERLVGALDRWLHGHKRDELIRRRDESRREVVTKSGLRGLLSKFSWRAKKATAALGDVITRLIGGNRPMFNKPVSGMRQRHYGSTWTKTPGGNEMIGVHSSNVFAVGWDADDEGAKAGTMFVQFRSESRVYSYSNAPEWMFLGLRSSPSPGRFVHAFIRPVYDKTSGYTRLA